MTNEESADPTEIFAMSDNANRRGNTRRYKYYAKKNNKL